MGGKAGPRAGVHAFTISIASGPRHSPMICGRPQRKAFGPMSRVATSPTPSALLGRFQPTHVPLLSSATRPRPSIVMTRSSGDEAERFIKDVVLPLAVRPTEHF